MAWNICVGEFRGENKIHELVSLLPLNGHRDFYCQI